jgi:hypothetical protein
MIVESQTTHSNLDGPISLKFHIPSALRPFNQSLQAGVAMVNQRRRQVEKRSLATLHRLIVDHVQGRRPKPKPPEVAHWS